MGDVVGHEHGAQAANPYALRTHTDVGSDATELATVDDPVPTVGEPVAVEARRHCLVGYESWSPVLSVGGVGNESTATAHMVEMPVGIDERVNRIG